MQVEQSITNTNINRPQKTSKFITGRDLSTQQAVYSKAVAYKISQEFITPNDYESFGILRQYWAKVPNSQIIHVKNILQFFVFALGGAGLISLIQIITNYVNGSGFIFLNYSFRLGSGLISLGSNQDDDIRRAIWLQTIPDIFYTLTIYICLLYFYKALLKEVKSSEMTKGDFGRNGVQLANCPDQDIKFLQTTCNAVQVIKLFDYQGQFYQLSKISQRFKQKREQLMQSKFQNQKSQQLQKQLESIAEQFSQYRVNPVGYEGHCLVVFHTNRDKFNFLYSMNEECKYDSLSHSLLRRLFQYPSSIGGPQLRVLDQYPDAKINLENADCPAFQKYLRNILYFLLIGLIMFAMTGIISIPFIHYNGTTLKAPCNYSSTMSLSQVSATKNMTQYICYCQRNQHQYFTLKVNQTFRSLCYNTINIEQVIMPSQMYVAGAVAIVFMNLLAAMIVKFLVTKLAVFKTVALQDQIVFWTVLVMNLWNSFLTPIFINSRFNFSFYMSNTFNFFGSARRPIFTAFSDTYPLWFLNLSTLFTAYSLISLILPYIKLIAQKLYMLFNQWRLQSLESKISQQKMNESITSIKYCFATNLAEILAFIAFSIILAPGFPILLVIGFLVAFNFYIVNGIRIFYVNMIGSFLPSHLFLKIIKFFKAVIITHFVLGLYFYSAHFDTNALNAFPSRGKTLADRFISISHLFIVIIILVFFMLFDTNVLMCLLQNQLNNEVIPESKHLINSQSIKDYMLKKYSKELKKLHSK